MNPKLSFSDLNRQHFSSIYESFQGAEAIYAERPLILHVRVTQISFDDWGLSARRQSRRFHGLSCQDASDEKRRN
jgi:hypothetical protein